VDQLPDTQLGKLFSN